MTINIEIQIVITIILICSVGLYIYYTKHNITESIENIDQSHEKQTQDEFIPSNSFIGSKKGYVFKKCNKGIGYYLDNISILN